MTAPFIRMADRADGQEVVVVADRFEDRRMTLRVDEAMIHAVTPAAARALVVCIERVLQEQEAGSEAETPEKCP